MSAIAQRTFMNNGGIYASILQQKYESGELVPPERYEHREYPKMIRISRGIERVTRSTLRIRGKEELPYEWEEDVEKFDEHIVNSEDEEERVLNGGKSDMQVEQERQDMIVALKQRGVSVDPSWTYLRLQREMGAAPSQAAVDALQARVAQLETEAQLRARIAELEAQMRAPAPDEAEMLRGELRGLGVEPDGRWSLARLRSEVEKATAP